MWTDTAVVGRFSAGEANEDSTPFHARTLVLGRYMPTEEAESEPNRRTLIVVGVVLVVALCAAAAFAAGIGPFGGGDGGEFPTVTSTPSGGNGGNGSGSGGGGGGNGGGGGGGGNGGGGADLPPYTFAVTTVENCGRTCRDVTVELTNNREQAAEDVVVYTRIFAGNTTDSGARVWQGREEVGEMEAGATTTATKRVDLSYSNAFKVQQQGGWITIRTTVRSADVNRTFTERRDVI